VYFSDVYWKFDMAKLSAVVGQVKNKHQASKLEIKEQKTRAFMNLARDIPLVICLRDAWRIGGSARQLVIVF